MLLHFTRNAVESVRNENVQIYTTKTPNTVNPNTLKPESSGPDALNSQLWVIPVESTSLQGNAHQNPTLILKAPAVHTGPSPTLNPTPS